MHKYTVKCNESIIRQQNARIVHVEKIVPSKIDRQRIFQNGIDSREVGLDSNHQRNEVIWSDTLKMSVFCVVKFVIFMCSRIM